MMTKSITDIYKNRPSVIRSTVFIWTVKIVAIVLAVLFFTLGISLLVMPEFLFTAIEKIMVDDFLEPNEIEQLKRLMHFFGFLFLIAGIIITVLIYFFNMVLSRNRFIKDLEAWYSEQYNNIENKSEIS